MYRGVIGFNFQIKLHFFQIVLVFVNSVEPDEMLHYAFFFVWFDSLRPINNLSVIQGWVFLGWTSTKLGLMWLLKDATQWRRWGSNQRPLGLEWSTLPLSHCAPTSALCGISSGSTLLVKEGIQEPPVHKGISTKISSSYNDMLLFQQLGEINNLSRNRNNDILQYAKWVTGAWLQSFVSITLGVKLLFLVGTTSWFTLRPQYTPTGNWHTGKCMCQGCAFKTNLCWRSNYNILIISLHISEFFFKKQWFKKLS